MRSGNVAVRGSVGIPVAVALLGFLSYGFHLQAPTRQVEFDGDRAFEHVRRLVAIGPRPSGSMAIEKSRQYIASELKSHGLEPQYDSFVAETPIGQVPMKNIIAKLSGAKSDVVIIGGHYDTKLMPGFVGANDGGSSTAAVLELARVLAGTRPDYTLWFVFFDGEEAVEDWSAMDGKDNTYGSRHMVARLKRESSLSRVRALVLLDMVGDRELDIRRDGESTPWLVDLFWKTAHAAGYGRHFLDEMHWIADDHIPFRDAGVPVVNLIDFNYGPDHSYWHTNEDSLDKVSGESMRIVGDVVLKALPHLFRQLDSRRQPADEPGREGRR